MRRKVNRLSEVNQGENDENQKENEKSDWGMFSEWVLFAKHMHEAINTDLRSWL